MTRHRLAARLQERPWIISTTIAILTALVFMPAIGFEFINWDDDRYLFENDGLVSDGLTLRNVARAMTEVTFYNWAPLTILSYQGDATLFGMQPWGFHLTNVVIHAISVAILCTALQRMTGRVGASTVAVTLFALHPLRVESVAWVAERKDVLSVLFLALSLLAYDAYCRQPSWSRYLAVAGAMLMSLLAKASLVTLPVLLLLLDVWPLGRLVVPGIGDCVAKGNPRDRPYERRSAGAIIAEKLPLFALSLLFSVITLWTQAPVIAGEATMPLVTVRVPNAVVATAWYLRALVLPFGLHPAYLHGGRSDLSVWPVVASAGAICAVCAIAWAGRHRQPWGIVGLAWFLVALAPMSGIVGQQGFLSHADRFTYIPHIGLIFAIVWAGDALLRHLAVPSGWVLGGIGIIVAASIVQTERQLTHWRNSYSLWSHVLALDARDNNWVAHNNLGFVLAERGQADEAIKHYRKSIDIRPFYDEAHFNLGNALSGRGAIDEAIVQYGKALDINPADYQSHNNLALALASRGHVDEAMAEFREALAIKPSYVDAHNNLGLMLAGRGQWDEAIVQYRHVLEVQPDHVNARTNLGNALANTGRIDEAVGHYLAVLEINPDHIEAHYNLGSALIASGQREKALKHYQRVLELAVASDNRTIVDAVRAQISTLTQ
jgi:protein O-mannosyl-transferase